MLQSLLAGEEQVAPLLLQCGFKSAPLPYQTTGIHWLVAQEGLTLEQRLQPNKSTILGDSMGLGKTPQTIAACMLASYIDSELSSQHSASMLVDPTVPPLPAHCAWSAPTLIIAPKTLMLQWSEEILKHTTGVRPDEVFIYHGASRTPAGHDLMAMDAMSLHERQRLVARLLFQGKRFIITTYETVVGDYTRLDPQFADYLSKKKNPGRASSSSRNTKKRQKKHVDGGDGSNDGSNDSSSDDDGDDSSSSSSHDVGGHKDYYDLDNWQGHAPSSDPWDSDFLSRRGPLFHTQFNRLILDEAQKIRNVKSNVSRAVIALRAQRRCVLSGTLFNNSNKDLCSVSIFLRLTPHNMLNWWKYASESDVLAWRKRYVLGRNKSVLKGIIPAKVEKVVQCHMDLEQQRKYNDIVDKSEVEFSNIENATTTQVRRQSYSNLLHWLNRLRQCCNDPILLLGREVTLPFSHQSHRHASSTTSICDMCMGDTDAFERIACGHARCFDCISSQQQQQQPSCGFCDRVQSPKTASIVKRVASLREENPAVQVVIVSQWSAYLDILERAFREAAITHNRYDGDIASPEERNTIVHRFQGRDSQGKPSRRAPPTVLLLSLHAGGLGLNLTNGSVVILCDFWFNPFVEEQAIDRCYRIGQVNTVTAIRYHMIAHPSMGNQVLIDKYMGVMRFRKQCAGQYYLENDLSHIDEDQLKRAKADLKGIFGALIRSRNAGRADTGTPGTPGTPTPGTPGTIASEENQDDEQQQSHQPQAQQQAQQQPQQQPPRKRKRISLDSDE